MQTELERIIEYRRLAHRLEPVEVQPIASPIVRLIVADRAVVAPPPELDGAVAWNERLGDWMFRRTGGVDVGTYLAWRATWETSHTLGRISSIRQLDASMRRYGLDLSGLASHAIDKLLSGDLTEPGARLTVDELEALADAVHELATLVRTGGGVGVALVESSPTSERTGLLRCWPPNPVDAELASRGTVTVRFSGPRIGVWYADDRDPISDVRSFELGIEGAVVTDAEGRTHVLAADATEAMCSVASDTTAWRVRRVPEVLVWADLLAALEATVDAVHESGCAPRIRLGDEHHVALSLAD